MDSILHQSILEGNVEKALHRTCECLLENRCSQMEETWIRIVSIVGERVTHSTHAVLFYLLLNELHLLIHKESLSVREALQFTAKLILSYQRPFVKQFSSKKTIQKLRSKVIDYFPSDAQLTNAGRNKFTKYLPTETEEKQFAERIVAGLMRIHEQNCKEDLREALEYLARKRITLYTVPPPYNGRIQPDDREDLIPYLWILLKAIRPFSYHKKLEDIYYYEYKPSYKSFRLGYFVVMAYLEENCATSTLPVWNQMEYTLLQRVSEGSVEMWKEVKQGKMGQDTREPKTSTFENFMPRRIPVPTILTPAEPEMDLIQQTKKIHIRKKRLKKTIPLSAKKSDSDIQPEDASTRDYSRGGRFDFSQTWPRTQNRISSKSD
jgi:hypothetical protein